MQKAQPKQAPAPRLIKPVSDKRKPLDQLYSKMRKQFLDLPENATCREKFYWLLHHWCKHL
ncbi:MAG: hypothetical protein EBR30_02460 [Cytophagia bacterium]|nr:hypothetical protein [Cytophagia bacterium]